MPPLRSTNMDRFSRLQALTGERDIISQELNENEGWEVTPPAWERVPKPAHLGEGAGPVTDEDRDISLNEARNQAAKIKQLVEDNSSAFADFENFQLGQRAAPDKEFCLLAAMKKYPYTFFVRQGNSQKVAERFFDKNQLLNNNNWDLFYLYKNRSGPSDAVVLVPTKQFEQFLHNINNTLQVQPDVPFRALASYQVKFGIDGMPQPRYLGRSNSKEMADRLVQNIPPNTYRLRGEPKDIQPTDSLSQQFALKIASIQVVPKGEKNGKSEKKKDRIAERQAWGHSIKRVQRYLGLRQKRSVLEASPTDEAEFPPVDFGTDKLAPFSSEGDIIFISVDVEAYERDKNKITEVGISTLDTRDLAKLVPGEGGKEWMEAIRHRHFRISDYKHLRNQEFVNGCPDRFEFGTSEFITLAEAPQAVASCFKHPFSAPGKVPPVSVDAPKRSVILVGHDVGQDVRYLRKLGYDVYNLSNLVEKVDTASMWRYLTREPNPRSLGAILAELRITGWNLHNAGNDAAYTLQAMIGIAIKAAVDKTLGVADTEKLKGIPDALAKAQDALVEWESNSESDGGSPVKPVSKAYKNEPWIQESTPQTGDTSQDPWTTEEKVVKPNNWAQDDSAEKGGWVTNPEPTNWGEASWGFQANSNPVEDYSNERVAASWTPMTGHVVKGAAGWGKNEGDSKEFGTKFDAPASSHQENQPLAWENFDDDDDGIPAGYSPGYRNNPIGAHSRSNRGMVPPQRSRSINSQTPAIGASVAAPGEYQPTAGNPVHRLTDKYRRGGVGVGLAEFQHVLDDLEDDIKNMEVSDHGNKGHVDAW